jgi:hypothetical protein
MWHVWKRERERSGPNKALVGKHEVKRPLGRPRPDGWIILE